LIETDNCSDSIATYDKAYLRKVISFGIDHWLELENSDHFKSVVFFKNHGPLSGGSMDHAHMQIVGLKNIDYKANIRDEIFEGIEIHTDGNSLINISTKPNACSTEINIITRPRDDSYIAEHLQTLVNYMLKQCGSYNLFFYHWNNSIICKLVARWVTSPFIIGYSIPHDSNRVPEIAEDLRTLCKSR
jgi:galactose-1-phosphate uridylyltransferase